MKTPKNTSNLERQILDVVTMSLGDAIAARLKLGYGDTQLTKMVDAAVSARESSIRKLIEESIDNALSGDIRNELKEAVSHKLARVLVSKMEGEIEKRVTELRASPEIRAKITLAVSRAIEEAGK